MATNNINSLSDEVIDQMLGGAKTQNGPVLDNARPAAILKSNSA